MKSFLLGNCIAAMLLCLCLAGCAGPEPEQTVPGATAIQPLPEATCWVADSQDPSGFSQQLNLAEFPGVTFVWKQGLIAAVTEAGERPLFYGEPVCNVFVADLTSDGAGELCATVSRGGGREDTYVVVFDYMRNRAYTLEDAGDCAYGLTMEGTVLTVQKHTLLSGQLLESGPLLLADWKLVIGSAEGYG